MAVWDQLPDEPLDSFEAFSVFRDLPKRHEDKSQKRSIANVSKMVGYKSITQCAKWSSKYKWVERADAWRKHQLETSLLAKKGTVHDFRGYVIESETRAYATLDKILGLKAEQIHKSLQAQVLKGEMPEHEWGLIDSRELKALLDAYDKLSLMKRRTAMMPTQFVKRDVTESGDDEEFVVSLMGDEDAESEAGDQAAQVAVGN